MVKSSFSRAVMLAAVVAAIFASCAQGDQLGSGMGGAGGGAASSGSSSGTGVTKGMVGATCQGDTDCKTGMCTLIGSKSYCTAACPPECPTGTYCSIIAGSSICVPDLGQQCQKCTVSTDCKLPSDACLTAPLGDTFCAEDCSVDGLCPNGFTCLSMASYEAPDAGAPDAGSGGAGGTTTGAGGSVGVGGGGGAGGAGGSHPTTPYKWCVPNSGFSCPCNEERDGVTNACSTTNAYGTCTGMETCDGKAGQWQGCTAGTPAAEVCNGKDDDCDGMIDEGDPNMLCAASGSPPPNSSWACTNGTCVVGACSPGWTDFPPGPSTQGCTCAVDADEPNQACAQATAAGMVTDVGGSPLVLTGTLSSAIDVDVYSFQTVDTPESMTNSYHVTIAFTQPMPNTEFVMDVERGDPCTDTPTGMSTSITAYDWCVNAVSQGTPPVGELTCGPTASVHCGGSINDSTGMSHSSNYYVRVYRAAGVTPTCTPYQITVTGGGGACDVTQGCQ